MKKILLTFFSVVATCVLQATALYENCTFRKESGYVTVDGKPAIKVYHAGYYHAGAVFKDMKVIPGRSYRLSFEVKSGGKRWNAFYLRIFFKDKRPRLDLNSEQLRGNEWHRRDWEFTVPADYKFDTVELQLHARTTGDRTVFYRNLDLKEIPAPEKYELFITSPKFRNNIYSTVPVKNISGFVTLPPGVKSAGFKLLFQDRVIASGEGNRFEFPAENLAVGEYTLIADCGKAVIVRKIRKFAPNKVEHIPDDDLVFRVNGKPFFPLIANSFGNIDRDARRELRAVTARQGFNVFFTRAESAGDLAEQLADARKGGYKLLLRLVYHGPDAPEEFLPWWNANVARVLTPENLANEALFAYSIKDEPAVKGEPFAPIVRVYRKLRELDPFRPIWINEAPHGTAAGLRDYTAACDLYGMDVYPVGRWNHGSIGNPKLLHCVGSAMALCAESVHHLKPIVAYLQAYSWKNDYYKEERCIYPTLRESRFMFYDSILNGVTAAAYYGFNYFRDPKFVSTLFTMSREINAMSGVLTSAKNAKLTVPAPLKALVKELDGKKFVIVCNYDTKPFRAEIKLPFASGSKIHVLFEKRSVNAGKNGVVKEEFQPFDVHIYALEELQDTLDRSALAPALAKWEAMIKPVKWIWGPRNIRNIRLLKEIEVTHSLRSALLVTAGDVPGELFINGKKVIRFGNFRNCSVANILKHIHRPGKYVLEAVIEDKAGSAGFFLDIHTHSNNIGNKRYVTDSSWKYLPGTDSSPVKDAVKKAKPVMVVAPLGKGPWGKRVATPDTRKIRKAVPPKIIP